MKVATLPSAAPVTISRAEKEAAANALLRAGIVRDHTNLHYLLTYLLEHSLAEHAEPLKEFTIGVEALGKPEGYDPRLDSTVRVDISKLRTKLREYYQKEGVTSPLRIEIPKGQYDLNYVRVPHLVEAPVLEPRAKPRRKMLWLWAVGIALVAGLLGFGLARFFGAPKPTAPALTPELRAFWQPYLQETTPTLFVYGTPMFVRLDSYMFRRPRLNSWEEAENDEEVKRLEAELKTTEKRASYKFTGVGEAEAMFMLTRLLTDHQATIRVKRSSNLSWEDLKGRHVVLLGSQKYNPQILKLPFQPKFEADRGRVTNLHPQPGEPTEYRNLFKDQFGEPVETYAIISVCEGLDPNTRVTILACSSNEGTGGAAEYVTRADTMKELFQQMKLDAAKPLPKAFQAVIRVKLNEGVPVQMNYITHHILTP
ncbi:MAG: hypothetical protein SF097_11780 [Acidobacteriota bacterium]|nr:hypothetical protein [Acidobacteriota bacterium]